jgi:hypothetical protein
MLVGGAGRSHGRAAIATLCRPSRPRLDARLPQAGRVEQTDQSSAFRGVVMGLLFSLPFWIVLGAVVVYLTSP